MNIAIDKLKPSPFNQRKDFAIDDLVTSVKEHGIIEPLVVREIKDKNGATYEIVAGERRFKAAQKADLKIVPVIVRQLTDEQAQIINIIENLERKDLTVAEEYASVNGLKGGYEDVAKKLGKPLSYVKEVLSLSNLTKGLWKIVSQISKAELIVIAKLDKKIQEELESYFVRDGIWTGSLPNVHSFVMRQGFHFKNIQWLKQDDDTLGGEGPCKTCKFNTGNLVDKMFTSGDPGCLKQSCLQIKTDNYLKKLVEYAKGKTPNVYFIFKDWETDKQTQDSLVRKHQVSILKDVNDYVFSDKPTDLFVINPKKLESNGFIQKKQDKREGSQKRKGKEIVQSTPETFETPYQEEARKLPARIEARKKKVSKTVIQDCFWDKKLLNQYKPDVKERLLIILYDMMANIGGIDQQMLVYRFAQCLGIPFKRIEDKVSPGGAYEMIGKVRKELQEKSVNELKVLIETLSIIKMFVKDTDFHNFRYFPEYKEFDLGVKAHFEDEYGEKVKAEQSKLAQLKKQDKKLEEAVKDAQKKNNKTGLLASAFINGKLIPIKSFAASKEAKKEFGYSDDAMLYFAIQSKCKGT